MTETIREQIAKWFCGGLSLDKELFKEEGYYFLTDSAREMFADRILSLFAGWKSPEEAERLRQAGRDEVVKFITNEGYKDWQAFLKSSGKVSPEAKDEPLRKKKCEPSGNWGSSIGV